MADARELAELSKRLRIMADEQEFLGTKSALAISAVLSKAANELAYGERLLRIAEERAETLDKAFREAEHDNLCWREIVGMVQEALGPEELPSGSKRTPLPASSIPPMNFDTAIRAIKRKLAEADSVIAHWTGGMPFEDADTNIGKVMAESRESHRAPSSSPAPDEGKP